MKSILFALSLFSSFALAKTAPDNVSELLRTNAGSPQAVEPKKHVCTSKKSCPFPKPQEKVDCSKKEQSNKKICKN